jgi:Leucine-rich repeat (LRR) protein
VPSDEQLNIKQHHHASRISAMSPRCTSREIARAARESCTSLDLSGQRLTVLPPEIGQLTTLQTLDLRHNQLTVLPPEIGRLTNLDGLYLDGNQLTALPPEIGRLTNLDGLWLDGNQLTALPPEIGQLTNLQTLGLRNNHLTALPPEIGQLTNLQTLWLGPNQLTALPPEIGQLTNLQTLDLTDNQLTALPPEIGRLTTLQMLWLVGNQLTVLPPEIGRLTNLQTLYLAGNQLTALPPEIGRLTTLQMLWLVGNQLTVLPPEIGQLTDLQKLDLDDNQLTALPPEIGQLTNLQKLNLGHNQLTAPPPEIGQLTNLQTLNLGHNQLTVLPSEIGQLTNLQTLYLHGNQLTVLPSEIGQLTTLQKLNLGHNQLTVLPSEIGQLTNLDGLYLHGNQLTALPPEILQLTTLQTLNLDDNQLTALPPEILQLTNLQTLSLDGNELEPELAAAARSGLDELRAYLVRLAREGEALYEAKLLLVGEGEVGKSSLLGALRADPWIEDRDSTHGLDIKELRLEHPSGHVKITLQGWDFGGQPVYRPTHQLFFSAPAVYLVVWKPREGPELNLVEYWIRLIRHRVGPGARVIVVATHRSKGRVARLDEPALRSTYGDMIVGFHYVDSFTGEGIPELSKAIAEEAAAIPGMGRSFPRSWRQARAIFNSTAAPYLSYGEFQVAVAKAGLDGDSAKSFARNSHELGRLIHYGEDPGLADLVVLRPDWLSRAISYVLEDQVTVDNKGLVPHARLAELWDDHNRPPEERYVPAVHSSLLRLMEHFDLSYRVARTADGHGPATTSLIAQLVPTTATLDRAWPPQTSTGRSELTEVIEVVEASTRQPVTPEGLIFQLLVRLHRFSLGRGDYPNAVHWSGGVVLDDGFHGRALLTVRGAQIRVTVCAAYPQFLMGQLTGEVRWLVEAFWKGLDAITKVPCGACPSRGAGLFDIGDLQLTKEKNIAEVLCPSCKQWQSIDSLLLGVVPRDAGSPQLENQARELSVAVRAIWHEDLQALRADVSEGFQATLSRIDERFQDYLRTLDDEAERGPRLFTLVPVDPSWKRPGWVKQRFRLTLYCEHSRLPVPLLSNNPQAGVYELEFSQEWVRKAAPVAKAVASVLSVVLPAAGAMAHIELGDTEWKKLKTEIDDAEKSLSSLVDSLAEGLDHVAANDDEAQLADVRHDGEPSGAELRQLHELLRKHDVGYGGLVKVHNNRRQPMWVHPRYRSVYVPPPPDVP